MSETLRDLVVSLSLNSDNFTRNIKSINKQIQEAESAFHLASTGVENFETTTAGLSARLSTLQHTFRLQQDAVGQYERALQQASDKLQKCYARQNDYAQRLTDAKDKQQQLKTEVASAAQAYKHYKNTLGETDSATIAAKANLDAYKGEYRAAVQEVKKLEGQNVALKKSTQNAADAFSAAQTKLNGAKGAVKETAAEIDQCNRQLALSRTSWASAGEAIQTSQRSIASIGKQMKTAESSYRLAAAGVKDFGKSAAGLTAKLTLLQEKLGLQQKAVAEYEKTLAAAKEQLQAAQQVNDPDKIHEATDAVQDAETALNNARAVVKQMIEDALAGKIDYILIKSISRFSRNTVDCLQYVRMLREKGVYLHFEKENIDTSSAYSEMLMTVLAAFAQEESVSISENIAWSFRKKYEAGIPRRFVLFGYRLDEDGEYRIVGEEAAVVREAFTLYEHGYSHKQIANAFNQKGYKSPTGLRWPETTIHRMLDNEKYVGDVMMQKRVTLDPLTHREVKNDQTVYPSYYVQDHHAAIIDRAQYNRVRKIRAMCNSKLGPLQYPYDDKLVCPICGQRLIQRRSDVLDNKSAWHCERNERSCERYVLNSVIVNEAVLNACKALNRDEIQVVIEKLQGKKPQRSKSREKQTAAEHLLELWKKRLFLKKVDYYWLDDTVDRITFSKENTLTVHWRCGLKTTVPLPVRHHRGNPVYAAEVYRKRKTEGTLKPRRRIQKRLEDPNPIPIIPVKEGQKK